MRENPGRLRTVANLKAVKVKSIKETTNYSLHSGTCCREGSIRFLACEYISAQSLHAGWPVQWGVGVGKLE